MVQLELTSRNQKGQPAKILLHKRSRNVYIINADRIFCKTSFGNDLQKMAPDARLLEHATTFSAFSNILDARLLRALADMGFARPTLIQARAIPLALDEHRDILARARTGSGKTAAYCLPIIQKILLRKGKGKDKAVVSPPSPIYS